MIDETLDEWWSFNRNDPTAVVPQTGAINFDERAFGRVHEWRRYVPEELVQKWSDLSDDARDAIYIMAKQRADAENWD
jgi:hypothetical protein